LRVAVQFNRHSHKTLCGQRTGNSEKGQLQHLLACATPIQSMAESRRWKTGSVKWADPDDTGGPAAGANVSESLAIRLPPWHRRFANQVRGCWSAKEGRQLQHLPWGDRSGKAGAGCPTAGTAAVAVLRGCITACVAPDAGAPIPSPLHPVFRPLLQERAGQLAQPPCHAAARAGPLLLHAAALPD
jgi:hypothetical protein